MKRFGLACLLVVLAAIVSLSSPAQAQITGQTYASPTAPGNTTCSPTAPCLLSRAISTAPAGGIVSCIDGGAFQNSTSISTSITIDCPGGVLTGSGPIIMGGAVPAAFTFTGTSSQVVTLRNLTFDGGGQEGAPFIMVTGGATLIIENCRFQNIEQPRVPAHHP